MLPHWSEEGGERGKMPRLLFWVRQYLKSGLIRTGEAFSLPVLWDA